MRTWTNGTDGVRMHCTIRSLEEAYPMTNERKTILFEEKYGVSIDDFDSIGEIDRFIESKIGGPLGITNHRTPSAMCDDNVFRIRIYSVISGAVFFVIGFLLGRFFF